MTMPNFLVIGAGKSGTSSLYAYLKQHTQVCMSPVKETNFFAYEPGAASLPGGTSFRITDLETYRGLFQAVAGELAIGEASPSYLPSPVAAGHIAREIPAARLIAILRQPADRAYSEFRHRQRNGREPRRDFVAAVRDEQTGRRDHWAPGARYLHAGLYAWHLKRYFSLFDRCQIQVYLYQDLCTDAQALMQSIYSFLGVDPGFGPALEIRHNTGSNVPRNHNLNRFLTGLSFRLDRSDRLKKASHYLSPGGKHPVDYLARRIRQFSRRMVVPAPPLDPDLRRELTEFYRADILELQDLIGRDLRHWLEPADHGDH